MSDERDKPLRVSAEYLTAQEVADRLKISGSSVMSGRLRDIGIRLGPRAYRWKWEAVEQYLERRRLEL